MPIPPWRPRRQVTPVAPGLAAAVRGGWAGFAVLLLGDLVTLSRGRGNGLVLYWVAAAAYAVAGNRAARPSAGAVRTAVRDGAGAAVFAYALTLPLRASSGSGITAYGSLAALGAAVVVGAAAAAIAARARPGRPAEAPGARGAAAEASAAWAPATGGPAPGRLGPTGARSAAEPRWPVTRDSVELQGGRRLQYISAGPPGAPPLVFHHGTPGAVGAWRGAVAFVAGAGLRFVVASRPGYGASGTQRGRRVADTAADVEALLDHLGADRFVTVGWSTGGPHALACAALAHGRCAAAAVVAGPAPHDAAGLDWAGGMEPDTAAEYALAAVSPRHLEAALSQVRASLVGITADGVAESVGALLAEADQRALAGPFADYLASTLRAGVAGGIEGWRDDDLALVGPWGFDLSSVVTPTTIWWGEEDLLVPPAHGRWLASAIPLARGVGRRGDGHLSVLPSSFGDIVASLASAACV